MVSHVVAGSERRRVMAEAKISAVWVFAHYGEPKDILPERNTLDYQLQRPHSES